MLRMHRPHNLTLCQPHLFPIISQNIYEYQPYLYKMAPTYRNWYPRVFNEQGNLKAFPFRRPLSYNLWNVFWVGAAFSVLYVVYAHWTFTQFCQSQFLAKDRTQLLLRKRSFDTLILANKIQSSEEQIKQRSIF